MVPYENILSLTIVNKTLPKRAYLSKKDHCIKHDWDIQDTSHCDACHIRANNQALFSNVAQEHIDSTSVFSNHLKANQIIYAQGDKGSGVFTVKYGIVKLAIIDINYKSRIVLLATAGMTIGLECLNNKPYDHYAVSLVPSGLCKIDVQSEEIKNDKTFNDNLLRKWQDNFTQQTTMFEQFHSGSTTDKIRRLIELIITHSASQGVFYMPTLDDISAIVAVSKENCSRAMSKLKKDNELMCHDEQQNLFIYQDQFTTI